MGLKGRGAPSFSPRALPLLLPPPLPPPPLLLLPPPPLLLLRGGEALLLPTNVLNLLRKFCSRVFPGRL
jgi:hypothetical protein